MTDTAVCGACGVTLNSQPCSELKAFAVSNSRFTMTGMRGGRVKRYNAKRPALKTAILGSTSSTRSTPQNFRQFRISEREADRSRLEDLQGMSTV